MRWRPVSPLLAMANASGISPFMVWCRPQEGSEASMPHGGEEVLSRGIQGVWVRHLHLFQRRSRMPEQSVVGVYDTMAQAEGAVRKLDEARFPITHVSIVSQNPQTEKEVVGYISVEDVAQEGLITGAWAGGLLGLLAGAAFLWIPGFGPLIVAGKLASLLLGVLSGMEGAVIGGAYGGVLGALAGWGVSKEHIFKYEEHVRAGKHLLIVHGNAEEVARAHSILRDTSATALHVNAEASA
jgi:hypothetical protein